MEFRLPCIDPNETVFIRLMSEEAQICYHGNGINSTFPVGAMESVKATKVFFQFEIGDKKYNSVYDDVIYIDGVKRSSLLYEEFEKYCQINRQIWYDKRFWELKASCFFDGVKLMNCIAIKKPSDKNIVEKECRKNQICRFWRFW